MLMFSQFSCPSNCNLTDLGLLTGLDGYRTVGDHIISDAVIKVKHDKNGNRFH